MRDDPGDWSLHPQLAVDTAAVGDLPLCRLLAVNDADYPWLILVPRRPGAVELVDLGAETAGLMDEIAAVSRALKALTNCDKLNVAAIGNVVEQLHVHVVARRRLDPLWPKPIWGAGPSRPAADADFGRFIDATRKALGLAASVSG